MSIRPAGFEVDTDEADRVVNVNRRDDGVAVTWACGDTRYFKLSELEKVIEHLELLPYDVWYASRDTNGNGFLASRSEDGAVHVNASWTALNSDVPAAQWDDLKEAIKHTLEITEKVPA